MLSIAGMRPSRPTLQIEKTLPPTRLSLLRTLLILLLLTTGTYLFLRSIIYLFSSPNPFSPNGFPITNPRQDAFKHFTGQKQCKTTQSSLYHIPRYPDKPPTTSPFCKNREALLTSMSAGSRDKPKGPFLGEDCQYKWHATPEICMILSRHNSISFIGNENTALSLYTAFNILLNQDLALGGLKKWVLGEKERYDCGCESQFSQSECRAYAVRSSAESLRNGGRVNMEFCGRVSHAYIPASSNPAPLSSITLYKDLAYNKPHPWQPSPLILSFSPSPPNAAETTINALNEWTTLAAEAERNIPLLFISSYTKKDDMNLAEIERVARERHFDVLRMGNLTGGSGGTDDEFEMGGKLVEAMIVVNWLAMISSS